MMTYTIDETSTDLLTTVKRIKATIETVKVKDAGVVTMTPVDKVKS